MFTTLVAMQCAWHQYTTQNQHQCQQWCCSYMFLLSRQHTFGYMYFTFYQNTICVSISVTQSLLNQDYSFMRGKCKYMAYILHNVTFPFSKSITLTTSAGGHLHDVSISITQSLLNQDYSFMRGKCKYMAYILHNVTFPFSKSITLTTSAGGHLHDDYIARFIPIVLESK